jgi:ABC-type nitrate/sulfonate/bicarbonate transport system permease component
MSDRFGGHDRAIWGSASFLAVFIAWEIASSLGLISRQFLSSPSAVLQAGVTEVQRPQFWLNLQVSAFEFTTGYVLAVVFAVPLGLGLGWYRRASYTFEPILNFLYATPRVALLPLIVLWLGIGIWSKVAIVFLGAFITILLNTYLGVRTVEAGFVTVARSFGASSIRTFSSVVFPSSLPFILAGMRLGVGRALIGIVVAELYAGSQGIGYLIRLASTNLQIDRMLFAVAILISFGLTTGAVIGILERRLAPWRSQAVAD